MSKIIKEDAGEQIDSLQYILFFGEPRPFYLLIKSEKILCENRLVITNCHR